MSEIVDRAVPTVKALVRVVTERGISMADANAVVAALDLPALLAAEREKALLAVQSHSEAELAAARERVLQAERERVLQALLGASWPDGDHDGFPSRRVSEMLADAVCEALGATR